MSMRDEFETIFPVPVGVKWCERQQDYTYENYRALDSAASYSGKWQAYQQGMKAAQAPASGDVEPVAYLVECDGLRWAHAEHKDAEVQAMRLGADVAELYTHPPAKVPTEYVKQLIKDAHCEGQQSATGREPSPFRWVNSQAYRNAEALLTTPTPATTHETEWVKCADRLPTEADSDDNGEVWWVTPNDKGEMTVISMQWSFGSPSDQGVILLDEATHWKPTGLKRPEPPTAQEGE